MITLTLMIFALCVFGGGLLYLGAGVVFLFFAIVFKALFVGLRLVFSLGLGAIFGVIIVALLAIKFIAVLAMLSWLIVPVFLLWLAFKIFGGRSRNPRPAYADEPYASAYRATSRREETLRRLNLALHRMERRMDDLESGLGRRR